MSGICLKVFQQKKKVLGRGIGGGLMDQKITEVGNRHVGVDYAILSTLGGYFKNSTIKS